jgi:hypothetical protein
MKVLPHPGYTCSLCIDGFTRTLQVEKVKTHLVQPRAVYWAYIIHSKVMSVHIVGYRCGVDLIDSACSYIESNIQF